MKKYWIAVLACLLLVVGLVLNQFMEPQFHNGSHAFGYFAAGDFAMGVFAAGQFSIGIFSAGLFSIGVFSISIFNIGLYATGIFVWGWKTKKASFVKET